MLLILKRKVWLPWNVGEGERGTPIPRIMRILGLQKNALRKIRISGTV